MHNLIHIWFNWVQSGGYWGIIALMAMESSIFPVPSEVVIPPAAFLAAGGKISLVGVIVAGTFGSWLGAAITFWVARWLGRVIIVRWGKYLLISEAKLVRAEQWVHRYEGGGVFFARLLPVIRHLISIPAGIIRMNFGFFSLMTVVGSAVWCSVLAYLGKKAYEVQPDLIENPEALMKFVKHQSVSIVAVAAVLTALYILVIRLSSPKAAPIVADAGSPAGGA
jgi:membrane protein DedA with SNARE-associated domain